MSSCSSAIFCMSFTEDQEDHKPLVQTQLAVSVRSAISVEWYRLLRASICCAPGTCDFSSKTVPPNQQSIHSTSMQFLSLSPSSNGEFRLVCIKSLEREFYLDPVLLVVLGRKAYFWLFGVQSDFTSFIPKSHHHITKFAPSVRLSRTKICQELRIETGTCGHFRPPPPHNARWLLSATCSALASTH